MSKSVNSCEQWKLRLPRNSYIGWNPYPTIKGEILKASALNKARHYRRRIGELAAVITNEIIAIFFRIKLMKS